MIAIETRVDHAEIGHGLTLLMHRGAVHELRLPKAGRAGTVSGYYDDVGALARDAARCSGRVPGVYLTLNPVSPALLARSPNRLTERAEQTTSDRDVLARRRLLLDFDPVRPAGISATRDEHEAALERALDVRAWLGERGWPAPARIDSGNGAHLIYALDLPNGEPAAGLVRHALLALAARFDDERVAVDPAVFNAARITKVAGTLAAKGADTVDRPHRLARVLDAPEVLVPVPRQLLEALAAQVPPDDPGSGRWNGAPVGDLRERLAAAGFEVRRERSWNGGVLYELSWCPWDAAHAGTARVIQYPSGARSAGCFHASCAGRGWRDVRELLGLGSAARVNGHGARAPEPAAPVLVRLADVKAERVDWLWPGRIARRKLALVVGDPGLGKSFITLDLAARVSTGAAWPDGGWAPAADVVILSAEDGLADTIRPRLDALGADSARVHALTAVRGADGTERGFNLALDLATLEAAIVSTRAALVVIDPATAYLGKTDGNKDGEVRTLLAPLAALADRHGTAVVAIMHTGKAADRRAIHRVLGSVAFVAAARLVLAVGKDPEDEERRLLAPMKNNLCLPAPVLAYRIAGDPARVQWEADAVRGLDADAVLGGGTREDRDERRSAEAFLVALLKDGPVTATEGAKAARANGVSARTLDRARRLPGVRAYRVGGFGAAGTWYWALTPNDATHSGVASLAETPEKTRETVPTSAKDATLQSVAPLPESALEVEL